MMCWVTDLIPARLRRVRGSIDTVSKDDSVVANDKRKQKAH